MDDLFSIKNKVVLITGSGSGLGLTFAEGMGKCGARIVLNGRRKSRLRAAEKQLKDQGIEAHSVPFDVSRPGDIARAVKQIESRIGPIDVLVNNAGVTYRSPLEDFPDREWQKVMDINFNGVFHVSKAVVKGMIKRKRGKIINITSILSEASRNTVAPYVASKGGVKMLTKGMATDWGKYNIQINALGPGFFITDMTRPLKKDRKVNAWIKNHIPGRRWGKPEELLGGIIFLASAASDFVNGHSLYVDGGFLAQL
jgi:gluconate 5-dehydrogenase